MKKLRKSAIQILSFVMLCCFSLGLLSSGTVSAYSADKANVLTALKEITRVNALVDLGTEKFFDESVVSKMPETVAEDTEISVIVSMNVQDVMGAYDETDKSATLRDFVVGKDAVAVQDKVARERESLLRMLSKTSVSYTVGEYYDTVLSGFEITVKAGDYDKLEELFESRAELVIGEVYEPCITEVVTNEVDVYETGIFDSSNVEYQGDGVVVAVLDTGLDYTHSAFSATTFNNNRDKSVELALTYEKVSAKVGETAAFKNTGSLTGADVYMNEKIPYAYDYADKDPDVLPINSEHGTHVAGIIAGRDDTITGVAPNAQIAMMKVFSDSSTGAKTSWLLAALEDCVVLGVDVINMSLGTACGFAREVDKENVNQIYDRIADAGITLIASAANQYNATMGSEKNGANGLTSNPDTGTVGSPSTYAGPLSVASVDGVKTPYLLYGKEIIYFNEASTTSADKKYFVEDILKTVGNVDSYDFEYVTIPGIGRSSDYPEEKDYYKGKIVLVKRGDTTFEEKIRIGLKEKGAAGVIIYNNISGTISMAVGADIGAACSISQDDGELLAKAGKGILHVSRGNVAGPFMSDFSSWGPTSDLQIKPEITAHGGEILSAIPGQDYERLSGTSMAAPNQAGAAALIRQYVKYSGLFGANPTTNQIEATVNQLMMSTADIILGKNGLPYAVRKQGAGLINISKSVNTPAYVLTYDKAGNEMTKTKLELGDDKAETGVYEMTFAIKNVKNAAVSYDISTMLLTEAVSPTYTSHADTTVAQEGYLLGGTTTTVTSVTGGTQSGNKVTVNGNSTATVTIKATLSEEDKEYLKKSFKNGMYVEGFVKLTAASDNALDLNVPVLTFFGDWTKAPIFDEEYYDTHKDEINKGLDVEDKLMADTVPTKVYGGLYSDYISTLGTYYFVQNPSATQIAASKDHIALSNISKEEGNSTVNSIRSVSAGMLRNAKEVNISIVDDVTGEEVYNRTEWNVKKSYSSGSNMYASSIDVEYAIGDHNLKNNTHYTVTLTAYIDYGEKEDQKNIRNTFVFPFYVDFEAPIVTDTVFRSEYDKLTKKTKFYADLSIYDNHYSMGLMLGQIVENDNPETMDQYLFTMKSFGKYMTPVYSSYNSTSTVTVELTDYLAQIKNSTCIVYDEEGNVSVGQHANTFIVSVYDYALNAATYEIPIPDEVLYMYFNEDEIRLNPNETKDLSTLLNLYPAESWFPALDFESSDTSIVTVSNQTILAKQSGSAVITAKGYDKDGNLVTATVDVYVLKEGDEGYNGKYTSPAVNKFNLDGYETKKAFYMINSSDRDIGVTDGSYAFGNEYSLKMFPSESVLFNYTLDTYAKDKYEVHFTSGNPQIASFVGEDPADKNSYGTTGVLIANKQGSAIVRAVVYDKETGKNTTYSKSVSITVKDPVNSSSIYLMNYRGNGGVVELPSDRGFTQIYDYAFSGYEYVDKDLEAGDVIDEEDPYYIKQQYIGENTITKVIIPEGVEVINQYAFAKLTALEEVVLPSTLNKIGIGAFYGCSKLKKINLEHVKFVNEKAFAGCILEDTGFDSIVAIGNYAFDGCKFTNVVLPKSAQSLGVGAFYNNREMSGVTFKASKIKLGEYAFAKCINLTTVDVNASVVSAHAFDGCTELSEVKLGKDISVIGEYAFADTKIESFDLDSKNTVLISDNGGALVYRVDASDPTKSSKELMLVAPRYSGTKNRIVTDATSISTGAFAGNQAVQGVEANSAEYIGPYAFAYCTNLTSVVMNSVKEIANNAFFDCRSLKNTPDLSGVEKIGDYAFAQCYTLKTVNVADDTELGNYAFAQCIGLENVYVGNDVKIGQYAFSAPIYVRKYEDFGGKEDYKLSNYYKYYAQEGHYYYSYDFNRFVTSNLKYVEIGDNANIGDHAFDGDANLEEVVLGANAVVGNYAFYNCAKLATLDFSTIKSIGDYAFSGERTVDFEVLSEEGQTSEIRYYINYAIEKQYEEGDVQLVDYRYTTFAPVFTTANLTALETLGEGAFAANKNLTQIIFSDAITTIAPYAFSSCTALESINIPENVSYIGEYAFYGTAINNAAIEKSASIGDYAFSRTHITEVTLKDGVEIGYAAFAYCVDLATVNNLENAVKIGGYAFISTAITEAKLLSATEIGEYAFAQSDITSVTLGETIEKIGDNPFFGCELESFGKKEETDFNGISIETFNETYDVNDKIKVIDGVLYSTLKSGGLQLVSYPTKKADTTYTVVEGTYRISARAFSNSAICNVTLPTTLLAIGDKAFFGCSNLKAVIFTSYVAPVLEEEFDNNHRNYDNLPFTGTVYGMGGGGVTRYEGLGISKYYMWNGTSANCFYYGANFNDYVGHNPDTLVMVKPSNGQNYASFIFDHYFGTVVNGNPAIMDATRAVIELIDALPKNIALSDEAQVVAARNAYNAIPSLEQQSLVSNYTDLTTKESTIEYLKTLDNPGDHDDPGDHDKPDKPDKGGFFANNWIGLTIALVAILGCAAYIVIDKFKLFKK